jgi:serine/threonine protein kinase
MLASIWVEFARKLDFDRDGRWCLRHRVGVRTARLATLRRPRHWRLSYLADRIARGPIPVTEAIRIFVEIAEGLEAAHERGVVHRDLKPGNVKMSRSSSLEESDSPGVKILDFGLAKALEEESAAPPRPRVLSASVVRLIDIQPIPR